MKARKIELKKDRIRKSNKIREITISDKADHSALEYVRIQGMSIQAAELSRENNTALDRVCIQTMSIQAAEPSRAHHATLERVCIRH